MFGGKVISADSFNGTCSIQPSPFHFSPRARLPRPIEGLFCILDLEDCPFGAERLTCKSQFASYQHATPSPCHHGHFFTRRPQACDQPPNDDSFSSETLLSRQQLPPSLRLQYPCPSAPRRWPSQWTECHSRTLTSSCCTTPSSPGDLHLAVMHTARALTASHLGSPLITSRSTCGHSALLSPDLSGCAWRSYYGPRRAGPLREQGSWERHRRAER